MVRPSEKPSRLVPAADPPGLVEAALLPSSPASEAWISRCTCPAERDFDLLRTVDQRPAARFLGPSRSRVSYLLTQRQFDALAEIGWNFESTRLESAGKRAFQT
jgi:hypothetical protein